MKNLLLSIMLAGSLAAHAQIPFNTMDSVYINNINATVLVHGDMFWDPQAQNAKCEYPVGSHKNMNFVTTLWMSGYDAGNQLHVAAQTYRQDGNDYWPGPLDSHDTVTYHTSHDWARIWKVNRSEIQYFQSLSSHTTANTPYAILTWPGKGNANAQGNGGTPITVTDAMAPFADLNANGVYEPLLGEYPDVPGDQALWWVFSDNGAAHSQSLGKPLGVEIHAMAYAYSRGTLIDNVIYFDYNIVNKSPSSYHNFRMGLFDDIDLGYFLDDYIGFDSAHRMGITYNATPDDGFVAGHPVNSYGRTPPVVGMTMIVLPGDAGSSHVPAGSFTYFNNDFSVIGNPSVDTQFSNYLRGRDRAGDLFYNNFIGRGIPCTGTGSGIPSNYVYSGDPSDTMQWSECNCGNSPGDRRFVISSNDFTLASGSSQHIVVGMVATDLDSNNGCPGINFSKIRAVADTAWGTYYSPLPPKPASVPVNAGGAIIIAYPNPAHDRLLIENTSALKSEYHIEVYNPMGELMPVAANQAGPKTELDISRLPQGVYLLRYSNSEGQAVVRFVKE